MESRLLTIFDKARAYFCLVFVRFFELYLRQGMFAFPSDHFSFFPREDTRDSGQFLRFTENGVENAALDKAIISDSNIYLLLAGREGIRRLCRIGAAARVIPLIKWQRTTDWVSMIGDCVDDR